MRQFLPLLIFVFIFTNASDAQRLYQNIRGKVTDYVTQTPLGGATVILQTNDTIFATTSNADGYFILSNVPVGRHTLKVSFVGYRPEIIQGLLLQSAKELFIEVALKEQIVTLSEVSVTAQMRKDKPIESVATVSARSFNVEQTERYAGSLGDVARMVGNHAGVVMQNDSRNDIIIRGNSPIGVIWRLDDVEIPNPNHFAALGTTGGPVCMLNNNLLTNSDFYTGAFPAQFGNGISGVFDLRMRKGNNQQTEFTGQVGFNGFEFGIEGPFSKHSYSSYLMNARYSTLAVMHKLGFGTGTGTAVPYYKDLSYKVYVPTKNNASFSLIGLYGNSHIDMGADLSDTSSTGFRLIDQHTAFASSLYVTALSYQFLVGNHTRIKTIVSHQQTIDKTILDNIDTITMSFSPLYRSKNKTNTYALATHVKTKLNTRNHLGLGFTIKKHRTELCDSVLVEHWNKFITLHQIGVDFYTAQAYAQIQHHVTGNFRFYGGLHSLMNFINNEITAEPRLGAEWSISNIQTLSLGYGLHTQMQPYAVYYLLDYDSLTNTYRYTNKQIRNTRSHHWVLSYAYRFSEHLCFKVEPYYQWLFKVPVSPVIPEYSIINAGEFFNIPTVDSLVNQGVGKNVGMDLTFERTICKGFYWLFTASLFDSKYKAFDGKWRNTAFNNKYVANLLIGYEWKLKDRNFLTFDVKTIYAGGKPYIPIDLNESISHNSIQYDYSKAYEYKFPEYFRMDIRLGFKRNSKRTTQEWAVDLQNITQHKSPIMQSYSIRKKAVETVYQMAFYPMFLYRILF